MPDIIGNPFYAQDGQSSPNIAAELLPLVTIGRITSIIVHEINNPLQAIQGGASLAVEEINDVEAVKTYLELIRRESDRVMQMTKILRSTYQTGEMEAEDFDLALLLEDVLSFIRDDFKQKNIGFSSTIPANLPLVHAKKPQIFLDLLTLFIDLDELASLQHDKNLSLSISSKPGWVVLKFQVGYPVSPKTNEVNRRKYIDKSLVEQNIRANGGKVMATANADHLCIIIELPAANK